MNTRSYGNNLTPDTHGFVSKKESELPMFGRPSGFKFYNHPSISFPANYGWFGLMVWGSGVASHLPMQEPGFKLPPPHLQTADQGKPKTQVAEPQNAALRRHNSAFVRLRPAAAVEAKPEAALGANLDLLADLQVTRGPWRPLGTSAIDPSVGPRQGTQTR